MLPMLYHLPPLPPPSMCQLTSLDHYSWTMCGPPTTVSICETIKFMALNYDVVWIAGSCVGVNWPCSWSQPGSIALVAIQPIYEALMRKLGISLALSARYHSLKIGCTPKDKADVERECEPQKYEWKVGRRRDSTQRSETYLNHFSTQNLHQLTFESHAKSLISHRFRIKNQLGIIKITNKMGLLLINALNSSSFLLLRFELNVGEISRAYRVVHTR